MRRLLVLALPMLCVWMPSCGDLDTSATLAIRVHSALNQNAGSLRLFPPNGVPLRVKIQVSQSNNLAGPPLVDLDVAWSELEQDPTSGHKYLLLTVPPNAGEGYSYLLRLSSVVFDQDNGGLIFDECGSIGNIFAGRGSKVRLDIVTHLGDCSPQQCVSDTDCPEGYCLSFECRPAKICANPEECPSGAICSEAGLCMGNCQQDTNLCTNNYSCCGNICSIHCPIESAP